MFLITPVFFMFYYLEMSDMVDLCILREREPREKIKMDIVIFAICFMFSFSLSIDFNNPNPLYTLPLFSVIGIIVCFIISKYVTLLNRSEVRLIKLKRNLDEISILRERVESRSFVIENLERENERLRSNIAMNLTELGRTRATHIYNRSLIPDSSEKKQLAKETISSIQDIVFDLKSKIPDGSYLELMDKTKSIYDII